MAEAATELEMTEVPAGKVSSGDCLVAEALENEGRVQAAIRAADAHTRMAGQPGSAVATSGPGTINQTMYK